VQFLTPCSSSQCHHRLKLCCYRGILIVDLLAGGSARNDLHGKQEYNPTIIKLWSRGCSITGFS
jgi:hypothetical protein